MSVEVYQFGVNNWALYYWRQHYNEWIRRSLYSFGEDDTFVYAFDHARGALHEWESQEYANLSKQSHTKGGYRLGSRDLHTTHAHHRGRE